MTNTSTSNSVPIGSAIIYMKASLISSVPCTATERQQKSDTHLSVEEPGWPKIVVYTHYVNI